jgi:hypothetical protein
MKFLATRPCCFDRGRSVLRFFTAKSAKDAKSAKEEKEQLNCFSLAPFAILALLAVKILTAPQPVMKAGA